MGVYTDRDVKTKEITKTIAFHWGSNTGSYSFCALDMATGDCVVSFANSENGPNVFQQLAEPVVDNIKPLFKWLKDYCNFHGAPPKSPETIATTIHSIHALETTQHYRAALKQLQENDETSPSTQNNSYMKP